MAGHLRRTGFRGGDQATVANDQIVAHSDIDRIAEASTDDDIVARTSGDDIRPTVGRRRCRSDSVDVNVVVVVDDVVYVAGVADHDIVARRHIDRIVAVAAENHIVAQAAGDLIRRAFARRMGRDQVDARGTAVVVVIDQAVVADHNVVAV